jgi:hypothetical protein
MGPNNRLAWWQGEGFVNNGPSCFKRVKCKNINRKRINPDETLHCRMAYAVTTESELLQMSMAFCEDQIEKYTVSVMITYLKGLQLLRQPSPEPMVLG